MIPKIEFKTYDVLTRVFLPPSKKKKEFESESKKFINHFKKIEKMVLILIEKFSGFKWTKKRIPVYLIPNSRFISTARGDLENGFPGVVQKIRNNPERDTHIFIHELTHVNQFQSDFYDKKNTFVRNKDKTKNFVNIEICADVGCIHVIRELFGKNSKVEKDYWHFINNVMTSTPAKKMKIPKYLKKWDLNKKSLRGYILK